MYRVGEKWVYRCLYGKQYSTRINCVLRNHKPIFTPTYNLKNIARNYAFVLFLPDQIILVDQKRIRDETKLLV